MIKRVKPKLLTDLMPGTKVKVKLKNGKTYKNIIMKWPYDEPDSRTGTRVKVVEIPSLGWYFADGVYGLYETEPDYEYHLVSWEVID